jgi:ribosomal protein S18 acetylase RimI-like enzyme
MITAPSIRAAEERDRAMILRLAARFAERKPIDRTDEEVTRGTTRVLGAALGTPRDDEAFFVATDGDDRAIGFIYLITHHDFFTDEPYVHISEVAVERDGGGVGRALIEAGEAWARSRGVEVMTLHVTPANGRAYAIYERAGYAVEHRKMRKKL